MHIALLEDDEMQAEFIQLWLESAGHACSHFGTARSFMDACKSENFDLLILDWLLPDINGDKVLRWINESHADDIPVIFVTSKDTEQDIASMLEAGADDYLVKPIRPLELLARITALGRRVSRASASGDSLKFGNIQIIDETHTIYLNDEAIPLTHKEFELSCFLLQNIGRLLSRDDLLEAIWKRSPGVNNRTVDTHVSRIRNKLSLTKENGWNLKAIYQHGYRLERSVVEKLN